MGEEAGMQVVGSRWSVVGSRWADGSVGMLPLVPVMRLRRISIRRYRATLLQGSTHVGPELQIYANPQHK